jgi:hypothetical protein
VNGGLDAGVRTAPLAESRWARFWHVPVRAERLALVRILLALTLLTDQSFQYLPHLAEFFGAEGVAPAGLFDRRQVRNGRWTALFFATDDMGVIYPLFGVWVAATTALLVGWQTRLMAVAVWFLTRLFIERNPNLTNGGDDTLQCGLFLLLFAPSGRALSVDAWLRRRRGRAVGPQWTPAWPVRLFQIQLCLIYLATGLNKLKGNLWGEGPLWERVRTAWWDGTAIHYLLNYTNMSRWSYVQLPLPLWVTTLLSYASVWWEVLFLPLVLFRRTRGWALWFGVLFHLGIWLTVEVGWFSFYTLAFYGVWVPCTFWARFDGPGPEPAAGRGAALSLTASPGVR